MASIHVRILEVFPSHEPPFRGWVRPHPDPLPQEREQLRNRGEWSKRPFAESGIEWSTLSRGERAGVRADQALLRFMAAIRVQNLEVRSP